MTDVSATGHQAESPGMRPQVLYQRSQARFNHLSQIVVRVSTDGRAARRPGVAARCDQALDERSRQAIPVVAIRERQEQVAGRRTDLERRLAAIGPAGPETPVEGEFDRSVERDSLVPVR